jgi:hypothetical protein
VFIFISAFWWSINGPLPPFSLNHLLGSPLLEIPGPCTLGFGPLYTLPASGCRASVLHSAERSGKLDQRRPAQAQAYHRTIRTNYFEAFRMC